MNDVRLTQFSHGAGCGCKIAPALLDKILATVSPGRADPRLWVGNSERDDAAVLDLGDGTGVISTTDFFMPIVDDPLDFGRIAAVNAISDVYAMGGSPLLAIAILGWPVDKLPPEVAGRVVEGGRLACAEAGIPLAGGHSIDSPEPIFGLAVTGRVRLEHLKRNGGAAPGDLLYLTKPLGVGILTTAEKRSRLAPEHAHLAKESMLRLNRFGAVLGPCAYVRALTDVTGFGLLGHLGEMCAASKATARVRLADVPRLPAVDHYLALGCVPGGTGRNHRSYGERVSPLSDATRDLLCDPQTSGGLLVAVDPRHQQDFEVLAADNGLDLQPFGEFEPLGEHLVVVDE